MSDAKKNLVSIGLTVCLMILFIGISIRFFFSQILLNEEFYFNLQEKLGVSESIQIQVINHLKDLMIINNLPEELADELIPIKDVEQIVRRQTIETIAFFKGDQDDITVVDPEPYVWELEPRIINYLNKSGYQIEETGYKDLEMINNTLYSLTRGDLQIFDVNQLIYSSTINEIRIFIKLLMGPLFMIGALAISWLLYFIWRNRVSNFIYWMAVSVLSASFFNLVMVQNRGGTVQLMVNETLNQTISEIISHSVNYLSSLAKNGVITSFLVILTLFLAEIVKETRKNIE